MIKLWGDTTWSTYYMHTRQDRWIQTKLVFTLAKNATKPNPLEIIPLQTTRKKDNRKTEETLERATVTLGTEQIKGSNPLCLWWWLWGIKINDISKTKNEVLLNGPHTQQIQNVIIFSRLLVKHTKTRVFSFTEVMSVILETKHVEGWQTHPPHYALILCAFSK